MSAKFVVFDAEGVRREVHAVDAREIIAQGGSLEPGADPIPEPAQKPVVQHPAEKGKKKK